ncbi:MAG: alcohol dehydrogenase catalytic domain-containing protein [Fuerstiella sp.]
MRAVCLTGQEIQFQPNYQPCPPASDLIEVKVLQAGICETDLQLKQGYMGFAGVLGHEFVGVAQAGRLQGQRVVSEINCACHACEFCRRDMPRHCSNRTVIGILNHDGAFADSVWVPEENLHAVPDSLTTEQAVFTEPVAAACRIPEQVRIQPDDQVVILGDGRLGNLCAQVLSQTGCGLMVVGKHQWKLDRLNELNIRTQLLSDFDPSQKRDYVIDCTGSPSGLELALQTVRPCGTIIQKTTVAAPQSLHMAPVVIDEVTILGSRCGPFIPALQLLADGKVQVESLISGAYSLEDAVPAFSHAQRPDALKILLNVND